MADPLPARPVALSLRRELGIGLATFALYLVVDTLGGPARTAAAHTHAEQLFRLEQRLHLDVEPHANAWLDLHPVLRTLADYEYGSTYIVAAFGLLAWLYLRRPDEYRRARTSFVLLNLIAIGCFAFYPVMPPRLIPDLGFVDTVTQGHTVGSWGSPLVAHANQLAAMPSLHVGWALWVSVVLARISGGRKTQLSSAVHVALTTYVVVATANHYLLDAVGAVLAVGLCALVLRAVEVITVDMRSAVVPAADIFFLHIDTPEYPQQVGGVVPLDVSEQPDGSPARADVVDLIRDRLAELPRFRQRLDLPASRWRRPRWQDVEELDWDWHVPVRDLKDAVDGESEFDRVVAELAATALPRDRPLWRMMVVHHIAPGRAAVVLIVHHVIADGIGTVAQALRLLEPPLPIPSGGSTRIGPLRRVLAVGQGLAQLATDGRAVPLNPVEPNRAGPNPAGPNPAGPNSAGPDPSEPMRDDAKTLPGRGFARLAVPLPAVRETARAANARVSDMLLCAVAGGLARLGSPALPDRLRVAVPLMVREPGTAAEGNVTAAVMIDLPVGPMPEPERLQAIAARSRRLRTGSRALASRFVMATVAGWMPPPLHAWFARTVYGPRYFQAVVSNMPGPAVPLSLIKAPLIRAFPLLPLAPGTPLTVGTLGWNGELCLAVSTGGPLERQAQALVEGIAATLVELGVVLPES